MSDRSANLERDGAIVPIGRRTGAAWEQVSPWLIAIGGGLALWIWNPPTDKTAHAIEKFLSGSIDAAAVLAGFQVTALTLLLAIADKPLVKRLKEAGFYNRIISFHWQAIFCLLTWLFISMVLLAVQGGTADCEGKVADLGNLTRYSAVLLTVASLAAMCASIRVTRLLVRLLRASG